MRKAILILLICYCNTSYAKIDLNLLRSLFESGNSQQAYEYAAAEVTTYEGDPNFDFYYGTAAIDTGHASQGVFALERVLLSQPDNHLARLELARGYFILEEYARARREFQTVLEVEPPADVVDRIYSFLDAIRLQEGRYTTTQIAYIELGAGSDSNVNAAPDASAYNFTIIDPNSNSIEQDDSYSELNARYGVNTPLSPGISFFTSINASIRKHSDLDIFNTATYTLNPGFQFFHANNVFTVDLIAQQFNVDDDEYRFLTGLNTSWRHHLSQQTSIESFLQFSRHDYETQPIRNANIAVLGTGFSSRYNVALSPVIFASLYLAQDDPESNSNDAKQKTERDYYGVRIGSILGTSAKTSVRATINYQSSKYGMEDQVFFQTREDDYTSLVIDFTWLIDRHWSLLALASTTQSDSNISIYEYERTQFGVNVRYEMK